MRHRLLRSMEHAEHMSESLKDIAPRPLYCYRHRYTDKAHIVPCVHPRLRSMLACPSDSCWFYASGSQIIRPSLSAQDHTMIFDVNSMTGAYPWLAQSHTSLNDKISTLEASGEFLFVGGWFGNYAMQSMHAPLGKAFHNGTIPNAENDSVNHIHLFQARRSGAPNACVSANNCSVSIISCDRNSLLAQHVLEFCPNASASSPDSRLLLVVGDGMAPHIVDADTGRITATLPPHADDGYACAWSSDGMHMATGYQDSQVNIFDTRCWEKALHTYNTEGSGAIALQFSPLGTALGGKQQLLVAEPANRVALISLNEASKGEVQKIDFEGEVSGACFVGGEGGNGDVVIANGHPKFGGLMEFENAWSGRSRRWRNEEVNWI